MGGIGDETGSVGSVSGPGSDTAPAASGSSQCARASWAGTGLVGGDGAPPSARDYSTSGPAMASDAGGPGLLPFITQLLELGDGEMAVGRREETWRCGWQRRHAKENNGLGSGLKDMGHVLLKGA